MPITADDIHLFNEGKHVHLYKILGAHPIYQKTQHTYRDGESQGGEEPRDLPLHYRVPASLEFGIETRKPLPQAAAEPRDLPLHYESQLRCEEYQKRPKGVFFAVWAPNAEQVFVIGDFNHWDHKKNPLSPNDSSGIWSTIVENAEIGERYKFYIVANHQHFKTEKADPFAFYNEIPPHSASIIWEKNYQWHDQQWMSLRGQRQNRHSPLSIYELHLGSWRKVPEEGNRCLTYREIAKPLTDYIKKMGFTHVEFMPLTEHPFYGSWGYQTTGYFAPTSRYGTPEDLKFLIDYLHQNEIGVILDWVPSHFPNDAHGLYYFDGTHLFEHADPRIGIHPDWNSAIFNYGRHEVRSFLFSSAIYWLEVFHIDALRVDAVASMLYLDYSRKAGEWIPNQYGGRENIEAIDFIRELNEKIYQYFPDVQTIAEESTSWGMVSKPTYLGGLGFGYKWDMGWMHDTLFYLSHDPIYRSYHHSQLTFRMLYAYSENFVLPLSHDEVVHGKGSLIGKMPGDDWQKFANLRLLFGYQYTQPGKKLIFMGGEVAQWSEWNHESSVEWHLLQYDRHQALNKWVQDLNHFYRQEAALYQLDDDSAGFEWIDCSDYSQSIISYLRFGTERAKPLLIVVNATPNTHFQYTLGVPCAGLWQEVLNSDDQKYGGSGKKNTKALVAANQPSHGRPYSITLTIPPLSVIIFKIKGAHV
ncbi:MAG: 1,4-alpha-glucan branching protein GlgB [Proteobacteria bacterium]|nr:1,4-alpha-glucan branching protein GlgB [Pseudomonadota bacterium]